MSEPLISLSLASRVVDIVALAAQTSSTLYLLTPPCQAKEGIRELDNTLQELRSVLATIERSLVSLSKNDKSNSALAPSKSVAKTAGVGLSGVLPLVERLLEHVKLDLSIYDVLSPKSRSRSRDRELLEIRIEQRNYVRQRSRSRDRYTPSIRDLDKSQDRYERVTGRGRTRIESPPRLENSISKHIHDLKAMIAELHQLHEALLDRPTSPANRPRVGNAPDGDLSTEIAARHDDLRKRRDESISQWIFQDKTYRTWQHSTRPRDPLNVLWCAGGLGSGKSFLVSHVLDSLQSAFKNDDQVQIAYFYFDSGHQQPVRTCLLTLLSQLVRVRKILPEYVTSLQDGSGWRQRSTIQELTRALSALIAIPRETFIVLDGVDEIQFEFYYDMERVIRRIKATGCKLFITTTRETLPPQTATPMTETLKDSPLEDTARHHFDDLLEPCPSVCLNPRPFDVGEILAKSLKYLVQALPGSVGPQDRLYFVLRILLQQVTSSTNGQRIKYIITWAYYARRPLALSELKGASVLAYPSSDTEHRDPISLCAGLLTTDTCSRNVVFSHKVVRAMLENRKNVPLLSSEALLARACLSYLLQNDFPSTPSTSNSDLQQRLDKWELLSYAASFWGDHLRTVSGPETAELEDMVEKLLKDSSRLQVAIEVLYFSRSPRKAVEQSYPKRFSALHWFAFFGLKNLLCQHLGQAKHSVHEKDSWDRTPVHIAVIEDRVEIVRLLLDENLKYNIDKQCDFAQRTAIHHAAENGNREMLELLVKNGASITMRDKMGQTPLQIASAHGHRDAVVYLLELSHQSQKSSKVLKSALRAAACSGEVEVMQALLDRGAVPDNEALTATINAGLLESLRLLLENGADIHKGPLLQTAVSSGNGMVIRLLFENGVGINTSVESGGKTALHYAARKGDVAIVNLLLEYGADVGARDENGCTPLSCAVKNGHKVTASVLISRGADLLAHDNRGHSPLSNATEADNWELISYLFQNGAKLGSIEVDAVGADAKYKVADTDRETVKKLRREIRDVAERARVAKVPKLDTISVQELLVTSASSKRPSTFISRTAEEEKGALSNGIFNLLKEMDTKSLSYLPEGSPLTLDTTSIPSTAYRTRNLSPTSPESRNRRLGIVTSDHAERTDTRPDGRAWFVVSDTVAPRGGLPDPGRGSEFLGLVGALVANPWSPLEKLITRPGMLACTVEDANGAIGTDRADFEQMLIFPGGQERRCILHEATLRRLMDATAVANALCAKEEVVEKLQSIFRFRDTVPVYMAVEVLVAIGRPVDESAGRRALHVTPSEFVHDGVGRVRIRGEEEWRRPRRSRARIKPPIGDSSDSLLVAFRYRKVSIRPTTRSALQMRPPRAVLMDYVTLNDLDPVVRVRPERTNSLLKYLASKGEDESLE